MTATAVPTTVPTVPTDPISRGQVPASTSPRAPGSMPAPKYCPASASSCTMPSRRHTATQISRARTITARSTVSRSIRLPISAVFQPRSRCIETQIPRDLRRGTYRGGWFRHWIEVRTGNIRRLPACRINSILAGTITGLNCARTQTGRDDEGRLGRQSHLDVAGMARPSAASYATVMIEPTASRPSLMLRIASRPCRS
jgi:hypothetical protein